MVEIGGLLVVVLIPLVFNPLDTNAFEPLKATVFQIVTLLMVLACLLYTSPSPRDRTRSRMPSFA